VLCALGSLSGWFFGACGLGMLQMPSPIFRAALLGSMGGGAVFGSLLGLWVLDHPVRRSDAVALTCLSGLAAAASQFLGCLLGTSLALLGPIALSAGMAGKIVFDRARLRRQTQPVLWPPDVSPRPLPAWYAEPGWASGFGAAQYALAAAFGAVQVMALGVLLDLPWLAAIGLDRARPGAPKIHWFLLTGPATIWVILWFGVYSFRNRPRREHPFRPPGGREDAGWSLVTLAVLFAVAAEVVVFLQEAHRPFAYTSALLGLLMIGTVLLSAIVLIAAWILPLIGRLRFSLFSILYSLSVLAAVGVCLFALWGRARGGP